MNTPRRMACRWTAAAVVLLAGTARADFGDPLVGLTAEQLARFTDGRDTFEEVEGYDEIQLALAAGYEPQTLLTSPEIAIHSLTISSAESLTVSRATAAAKSMNRLRSASGHPS